MRGATSLLLLSLFALSSATVSAEIPVHESFTLHSSRLSETRRVNVYRPPVPNVASARLPVLYVLDGGIEEDFPHVAADVDAAIRAGEMRPLWLVGIENTERRRDMTGPTEIDTDRKIAPRVGGSAAFRAFLREELLPEIARRFPVGSERAIIGESLAGLFVLETFFEEPALFPVSIALSPSLQWNDRWLARHAAESLRSRPAVASTVYVATTRDDGNEDALALLEQAFQAGAPKSLDWTCERRTDLEHATIYRAASPALFRRFFPVDGAASAGGLVRYPEEYRGWSHVKSSLISPSHADYARLGGFQHIYANTEAIEGYRNRQFPEGSVIVFDWLEMVDTAGAFTEGPRRQTDVMVKDSARFPATGGWGFQRFVKDSHTERAEKPAPAQCFACHDRLKKDGLVLSSYRE